MLKFFDLKLYCMWNLLKNYYGRIDGVAACMSVSPGQTKGAVTNEAIVNEVTVIHI